MEKHKLSKLGIVYLKIVLSTLFFLAYTNSYSQSGVGIGTSTPNANAVLDIVSSSNDKGILIPRLTSTQRTAMNTSLTVSENGLMVFDTDLNGFYFWNGTAWNAITVVQDLQLTGNTLTITNNASATDIDLSSIAGTNTDNQTLALTGSNLTITGGNSIDLSPIQDGVDDADNNPVNEIQDLQLVGNTLTITNNASATDIDLSSISTGGINTDNQTLALAGSSLTITGGNSVDLSPIQDGVDDADNNPLNEIQDLQLVGNTLTITNNVSATDINLAAFSGTNTDNQTISLTGTNLSITGGNTLDLAAIQDGVDDADADPTNELQTVSKVGNTITLSNGGGSFTDAVNDSDADATNEIQDLQLSGNILTITNNASPTSIDLSAFTGTNTDNQTLSLAGTDITITGGNTLDLSPLQDGVDDADNDPTNEIQTITKVGSTVTLSNGGGSFTDADASASNELQTISKTGVVVTLSDGGGSFNVNDADASTSNELQNLGSSAAGTNRTVTITGGTDATFSIADNDNSTTNEIQTIARLGSTVTLSDLGGSFSVNDADASASNELQTVSKTGVVVTLSNGGGSFTDAVNDADASTTNELQTLAQVLLEGNSAGNNRITNLASPLNPNDAARKIYVDTQDHTDNQTLSVSGNTLIIAGGNSVTLPSSSPTQDAFKAYLSGNLSVSSGGGAIDFDVVDYDVTGSGTYGGGKYSPPVNGIYAFTGVFDMQMAEASSFAIIVTVDGVSRYSMKARTSNGGGSFIGFGFSTELKLNAGETVQFELSSANSHTLFGGTEFRSHISGRLVIEL